MALSASAISNPHSPLFVGIVPSKSSARAANLLAAFFEAALCLLAPSREVPAFCFDCARRRGDSEYAQGARQHGRRTAMQEFLGCHFSRTPKSSCKSIVERQLFLSCRRLS